MLSKTLFCINIHIGMLNHSCTKVFRTHTFYEGGGGGGERAEPTTHDFKTVDSTVFNFGRPLILSMRGKKLVELMV